MAVLDGINILLTHKLPFSIMDESTHLCIFLTGLQIILHLASIKTNRTTCSLILGGRKREKQYVIAIRQKQMPVV